MSHLWKGKSTSTLCLSHSKTLPPHVVHNLWDYQRFHVCNQAHRNQKIKGVPKTSESELKQAEENLDLQNFRICQKNKICVKGKQKNMQGDSKK